MSVIVSPHRLEQALIKHGLVPPECRVLDVVIEVMRAPIIRYEVFVSADRLAALSRAFADALEEPPTP